MKKQPKSVVGKVTAAPHRWAKRGARPSYEGEVAVGFHEVFLQPWDKALDGWPVGVRCAPSRKVKTVGVLDVVALSRLARDARRTMKAVPKGYSRKAKGQLRIT